jgi:hypothetical protein
MMGRWGDGAMGRWGDGAMGDGRWGEAEDTHPPHLVTWSLPALQEIEQ